MTSATLLRSACAGVPAQISSNDAVVAGASDAPPIDVVTANRQPSTEPSGGMVDAGPALAKAQVPEPPCQ